MATFWISNETGEEDGIHLHFDDHVNSVYFYQDMIQYHTRGNLDSDGNFDIGYPRRDVILRGSYGERNNRRFVKFSKVTIGERGRTSVLYSQAFALTEVEYRDFLAQLPAIPSRDLTPKKKSTKKD